MYPLHSGVAVCAFTLALIAFDTSGETIFKCVGENGQVHYQSTKCEAERPGVPLIMRQATVPHSPMTAQPVTSTAQPKSTGLPGVTTTPAGQLTPYGPSGEKAEAFKQEMSAYLQCTRDHANGMRLTEAAQQLINFRDRRHYWEALLLENSKSKYPNTSLPPPSGFPQMVAQVFDQYKTMGGTAATVEEVQPVPPPCVNPWTTISRAKVPISASEKMMLNPE